MITPELLRERGFVYRVDGISGADSWHGMPWWNHGNGLALRGSCSTSGRSNLILYPYITTRIETIQQLDNILTLFLK